MVKIVTSFILLSILDFKTYIFFEIEIILSSKSLKIIVTVWKVTNFSFREWTILLLKIFDRHNITQSNLKWAARESIRMQQQWQFDFETPLDVFWKICHANFHFEKTLKLGSSDILQAVDATSRNQRLIFKMEQLLERIVIKHLLNLLTELVRVLITFTRVYERIQEPVICSAESEHENVLHFWNLFSVYANDKIANDIIVLKLIWFCIPQKK